MTYNRQKRNFLNIRWKALKTCILLVLFFKVTKYLLVQQDEQQSWDEFSNRIKFQQQNSSRNVGADTFSGCFMGASNLTSKYVPTRSLYKHIQSGNIHSIILDVHVKRQSAYRKDTEPLYLPRCSCHSLYAQNFPFNSLQGKLYKNLALSPLLPLNIHIL